MGAGGSRGIRRLYVIAVLAGATCLSLIAVQAASARVAKDPCGTNTGDFVSGKLHCGRIFNVQGQHTIRTPENDAPPPCSGGYIAGFPGQHPIRGLNADWDYWTNDGKWVFWDLDMREDFFQKSGRLYANRIWPGFHNSGHEAWPVRVYFYCTRF
jgi:hypothetical protein